MAVLAQAFDRSGDPAFVMEARLARPDIEPDAEGRQAGLDPFADTAGRPLPDDALRVCPLARRRRPDVIGQLGREVADVGAVVAVIGDRLAAPEGRDRGPEVPHLPAGIVEVVLARDPLTACLEDAAQQVTDECASGVADVERAGRVGRHELDVDRAWPDRRDAAP